MITIDLNTLSYIEAVRMLEEEGYIQQEPIQDQIDTDIYRVIYSYFLYYENKPIDCIDYIEYCKQAVDYEYEDGRLTLEAIKTEFVHSKP